MLYTAYLNNKNYDFNNLDDLFNQFFGVQSSKKTLVKSKISIPADAFAHEDGLIISYEIPGINPDTIKITAEKDELLVTAEKPLPNTEKVQVLRTDLLYGSMSRSFKIGSEYDLNLLECEYVNGTLNVKIPRKPETKPKTFTINVQKQLSN